MRIQASAGRDKKKDLSDFVYKLTLTANGVDAGFEWEGELLCRLYQEFRAGNAGYLLRILRKWQREAPAKPRSRVKKKLVGK